MIELESPGRSPMSTLSKQEWEGLSSEKFPFNQRKHFSPRVTTDGFSISSPIPSGRVHFSPAHSPTAFEKLCLRTFPHMHNRNTEENLPKIRPKLAFVPIPRAYGHKQRRHLEQDRSPEWKFRSTIKTFHGETPVQLDEVNVEMLMGRKRTVDSMEDQRNLLGVRSMGDKIYKSVEYSPGFFHERGLIVGSTITYNKVKKPLEKKLEEISVKGGGFVKGMSWREREKREERAADEKAVRELNDWERNTFYDERGRDNGSKMSVGSRAVSLQAIKKPILKKRS